MALKPTIYKFSIALTDVDANRYEDHSLTVALHPSETMERMLARVLAFCLVGGDGLAFTKGLSEADEPDLWRHSLDGQLEHWIDVGEPAVDRLKKACGRATSVDVFTFNSKSDTWWAAHGPAIARLGVTVQQFSWTEIQALAAMIERTTSLSLSIDGESAFVATDAGGIELHWVGLN